MMSKFYRPYFLGVVCLTPLVLMFLGCIGQDSLRASSKDAPAVTSNDEGEMEFKFENYSTAEAAQRKLVSMFPVGTPVQELLGTLKLSRTGNGDSTCIASLPGEKKYIFCRYLEDSENPDSSTLWAVVSYQDEQDKIKEIQVDRGNGDGFLEAIQDRIEIDDKVVGEDRSFKFEDYESVDEVKEKLGELFPPGSQVRDFTRLMRAVGADCYGSMPGEDGLSFCHYEQKGSGIIVRTTWVLGFKADDKNNLEIVKVKTYLTGP
jgi:hypothetical protein